MPFVLLRQNMHPDAWVARASDDVDFSQFLTGARVEPPKQPVRLELAGESELRSDFLEAPYCVVSAMMRKSLEEFGIDNIDYYRTTLYHEETGEQFSDNWLGNVIGNVRCVDEAKSSFKSLSGGKKILRQFVVDEKAAAGRHLFRVGENRRLVLISVHLQHHLQSANLHGLYFQNTQEFDGNPVSSYWD